MGGKRARTEAGIVLDAGALIALDRGDRRMAALLQRALARGWVFRVPAGVVGQAWRDGRVQVSLVRFLRGDEVELCAAAGSGDVIDASVVILARERRDPIVTSDPQDLRRLDPAARIVPV